MRSAEIRRLLPSVFQRAAERGGALSALLAVIEDIHAPTEAAFSRFPQALDPRTAPDEFVQFLAEWVDVRQVVAGEARSEVATVDQRAGDFDVSRLRELTMAAAELAQWRGTRRGFTRLLELATGVAGFDVAEGTMSDGTPRPFAMEVIVPHEAAAQLPLIQRIVQQEKPAYATCSVRVLTPPPSPTPTDGGSP